MKGDRKDEKMKQQFTHFNLRLMKISSNRKEEILLLIILSSKEVFHGPTIKKNDLLSNIPRQ